MKPAVSWHTILLARASVLYLWRPWVAEGGCSGQEQALSVSHRTGGFCVLPDEKPRSMPKAESACLGVGGAAERGEFRKKFLERSSITGGAKGISIPRPAEATLLLVFLFVVCFTCRAAEILVIALCKECFHAVLAKPQAGGFVCQHEAEHHLDRQQQGMKIPNNGGPLP